MIKYLSQFNLYFTAYFFQLSSVATTSADLRLHEKSKKCMLYNGAICEFGCETRKR